jgi:hypothetical protein
VRRLAQPETLKSAVVAAGITALACYPRLRLWTGRVLPLWYLESLLFLGTIVLWAFVFAWHTHYSGRPVLTLKPGWSPFAAATFVGVVGALALHHFLDPALRARTPEDFPASLNQWLAMTLFSLAFSQLFLLFAPFAWLLRLFQSRWLAAALTVLFGVFVLALKASRSPQSYPGLLLVLLLLVRIMSGCAGVLIYWRGGLVAAWWMDCLLQMRHLLALHAGS